MDVRDVGCESVHWIELIQSMLSVADFCVYDVELLRFISTSHKPYVLNSLHHELTHSTALQTSY
jgi:hypothetical protein